MIFESIGAFLTRLTFFYAYVDNNSSFPKPLNKDEEFSLVEKMAQGDENAKQHSETENLQAHLF